MAVFVDLEDDDVDLPQPGHNGIKPLWPGTAPVPESQAGMGDAGQSENIDPVPADHYDREEAAHEPAVEEETHSMTVALGCYP